MLPTSVFRAVPAFRVRGCRSREQPFSSTARARGPDSSNVVRLAERSTTCPAASPRADVREPIRSPPRESWASSGATTRNSCGPSHRTLTRSVPRTSPQLTGRPPVTEPIRLPASEVGSTRTPAMVWNGPSLRVTVPCTDPESNASARWEAGLRRISRSPLMPVKAAVLAIFAGPFGVKQYGFCHDNVDELVAGGGHQGFADPVAAVLDQRQGERAAQGGAVVAGAHEALHRDRAVGGVSRDALLHQLGS